MVCRGWRNCSRRASRRIFAIISEIAGRVEFGNDYKAKRRIVVRPEGEGAEPREYLIPKDRHITVQEGDWVEPGDLLMDGNAVPHDILAVLGIEALADYLINEIQEVYRLQGVPINDKHIEVIVRQMMQKTEVLEPGDTTFLVGEQIDRHDFEEENDRVREDGGDPARAAPCFRASPRRACRPRASSPPPPSRRRPGC